MLIVLLPLLAVGTLLTMLTLSESGAPARGAAPGFGRAPRVAAQELYDYANRLIRSGDGARLHQTPDAFVAAAQIDMRMKVAAGQEGFYGPKTRARGKELLGREFPKA